MKKVYLFMILALAMFAGVGVTWARLIPGYDPITEVKDGDQFYIKGEYGVGNDGTPLNNYRWFGVQNPRIGDEDNLIVRAFDNNMDAGDAFVFTAEAAGSELNGHPAFYIKNNFTGKYLVKDETETEGNIRVAAINLTADKAEASLWAFAPVSEKVTAENANVPYEVLHMYTLSNDGTVVYFNNNYAHPSTNTWNPRVATWTDGTTWCTLYPAEEETDAEEAAINDLNEVYEQAKPYYPVTGGSEPGFYPEDEANAFNEAFENANVDDILMNEDYSGEQLIEQLIKAKEALEKALAPILLGPIPVKSGQYYYIVSAYGDGFGNSSWQDGQTKAILMGSANVPRWATLEEMNTSYIWLFTEMEDGNFSIKNLASDTYMQSITQSGTVPMGTQEKAVKVVSLGQAQFNLTPVDGNQPLHPAGHNEGAGTEGNIVGWGGGVNTQSAWFLRTVPQSILDELLPDVEKELELKRTQDELVARIYEIGAAAKPAFEYELSDEAEDVTPLSFEDFTSNAAMLDGAPEEERIGVSWGNDGTGYAALIDGNTDTYFHTKWSDNGAGIEWTAYVYDENNNRVPAEGATRTKLHNLGMKLAKPVSEVTFEVSPRDGVYNNPTKVNVEVSEDGIYWQTIIYGYDFFKSTTKVDEPYLIGPFQLGGTYQYVRFANYMNDRQKNGPFFTFSELKAYVGARLTATCQASTMDQKVVSEFLAAYSHANQYADVVTYEDLEAIKEALASLNEAYEAFLNEFADPTPLQEAIAQGNNVVNTYIAGSGQIGLYDGSLTTGDLEDAIAKGQDLLDAGYYNKTAVTDATNAITAEIDKLAATIIMPEEGKWYQLKFASAEEYATYNFTDGAGLVDRVAAVAEIGHAPQTETDEEGNEITIPGSVDLYPYADEIREGARFYTVEPDQLSGEDVSLSYFRFISVGDSAYVIQNMGTGLYIPYLPYSSMAYFNSEPGLFKVDVLGAGFVTLSSYNLYDGTCRLNNDNPDANTLHFSNPAQNFEVRGWPDHALGTKSSIKIIEVADGGEANPMRRDLYEEEAYGVTFNTDITNFNNVYAYSVLGTYEEDDLQYIGLKEIETLAAGEPAILVGGNDVAEFSFGTTFANKLTVKDGIAGTFANLTLKKEDDAAVIGFDEEEFVPVVNSVEFDTNVNGHTAYIVPSTLATISASDADLSILFKNTKVGIKGLSATAKAHDIYNLSGQRVGSTANVEKLNRGIYVINGRKVLIP